MNIRLEDFRTNKTYLPQGHREFSGPTRIQYNIAAGHMSEVSFEELSKSFGGISVGKFIPCSAHFFKPFVK